MKPPIRWAGGKTRVLKHIKPLMPQGFKRYVEPFAGGAALFFDLELECPAILCDTNRHLLNFYRHLRDKPGDLIQELVPLQDHTTESRYIRYRNEFNDLEPDTLRAAALFLYLNKTNYSGMYRVAKSTGRYNVPWGSPRKVKILDTKAILNASRVLHGVDLMDVSAFHTHNYTFMGRTGDFWYLDPPYHKTWNGYGEWNGWEDQVKVKDMFWALTMEGCHVMASNLDTPEIRELYKGHIFTEVPITHNVGQGREPKKGTKEVLIRNWV